MTRIDLDGDGAADGLLALVIAVIELLVEAMEREAVRRMSSGQLSDDQVERLGTRFASIEDELDRIKEETDTRRDVDDLRGQLHGLVDDAVSRVASDDLHESPSQDVLR